MGSMKRVQPLMGWTLVTILLLVVLCLPSSRGSHTPSEDEFNNGCIPFDACHDTTGGLYGDTVCSAGYTNSTALNWCDKCAEGYYRLQGKCESCFIQTSLAWQAILSLGILFLVSGAFIIWFFVVALGGAVGLSSGITNMSKRAWERYYFNEEASKTKVRRTIEFFRKVTLPARVVLMHYVRHTGRLMVVPQKMIKWCQLSFLVFQTDASWPASLEIMRSFMSFSSFQLEEYLQPDCHADDAGNFLNKFLFKLSLPVAVCFIPFLVAVTAYSVKFFTGKNSLFKFHFQSVQNTAIKYALFAVSLMYVTIHAAILEPFTCQRRRDGAFVMRTDAQIECYKFTGQWVQVFPFAVMGLGLFSIGIPLYICGILLVVYRRRFQTDTIKQFGFLYTSYRKSCYLYEPSVVLQKFFFGLSAILLVLSKKDMLVFLIFVQVFFYLWFVRLFPYGLTRDNAIEFSIGLSIFTLIIAGLIFDSPNTTDHSKLVLETVTWVLYGWVFVLFLIVLLWDWQIVWWVRMISTIIWRTVTLQYCRGIKASKSISFSSTFFKKHIEGVGPAGSVLKDAEEVLRRTGNMLEEVNMILSTRNMGADKLEQFLGGKKKQNKKRLARMKKEIRTLSMLAKEIEGNAIEKKRKKVVTDDESSSSDEEVNIKLPAVGDRRKSVAELLEEDIPDYFTTHFMRDVELYTAELSNSVAQSRATSQATNYTENSKVNVPYKDVEKGVPTGANVLASAENNDDDQRKREEETMVVDFDEW